MLFYIYHLLHGHTRRRWAVKIIPTKPISAHSSCDTTW